MQKIKTLSFIVNTVTTAFIKRIVQTKMLVSKLHDNYMWDTEGEIYQNAGCYLFFKQKCIGTGAFKL